MTSSTPAPTPTAGDSLQVLKRVRATEVEWEQKLADARRASEESLAQLREETAAALQAEVVAAETDRARSLERARVDVDREVARILTEGERAAEAAAHADGKRPQDRRDQVLAKVLGPLAEE